MKFKFFIKVYIKVIVATQKYFIKLCFTGKLNCIVLDLLLQQSVLK